MKKKIVIFSLFLLILLNHLWQFKNSNQNQRAYEDIDSIYLEDAVDFSYRNQKLVQTIVAKDNNFNKINIYLDPVDGELDDIDYTALYLKVALFDENNKIIEEYKYEKVFFDGEGLIEFRFPTIKNSMDKKYYLHITGYKENDIPMKLLPNEVEENRLYIDGDLSENSLIYINEYETSKVTFSFYLFTIIITITLIITFIFFYVKGQKFPIHKQYLILAIILSLLMIFISPLYVGHDELAHLGRVYELSNGRIFTHIINNWPQTEFPVRLFNGQFSSYLNVPMKIASTINNDSFIYLNMEFTSVYSPISYIPQIIGLLISSLLPLAPFFWPYICRIMQALLCIFITYKAIKIIPFGKNILFFIGFIPTFIKATTLISADSMLVSCSILFIAKILQIIYEKKEFTTKDYIILLILGIIISISKLVYFPLSFLVLFIPYKLKLDRKRIMKKIISIILISLIVTLLWNGIASINLTSGQGVNVSYYIQHYLRYPLEFIQITLYTFYNQLGNFISDLFGGENNWASNTIFDSSIIPLLFIVLYVYITMNGENKLNIKDKRIIAIILIITYLLISTTLLLTCTPVYYKDIVGIQGRYFICFLLPIYLIFANKKKENKNLDYSLIIIIIYLIYYLKYFLMFL